MGQKICAMRRWYGGKEKITIYLDTEKFSQIKERFQLPRKLNFKIMRWWQDPESLLAFFAIRIIDILLMISPLKKFESPRLVLGRYSYPNKHIRLFVDKIWLFSDVNTPADFINEFCFTAAHEARHSKDLPDEAAIQVYLASKENARFFEKAADDFAEKHKADFKKIFIFEVKK